MICMVYISSAKLGVSEREIAGIVNAAKVKNEHAGITGILLYNNGNFMQLIEGDVENVESLFDIIKQDRRHSEVTLLLKENITHRNFDEWRMAFKNIDSLKKMEPEILSPFLSEELDFSIYQHNPYRALTFLETFKRIIR